MCPSRRATLVGLGLVLLGAALPAQQMVTETRDPKQQQDEEFAKLQSSGRASRSYGSPLVDHLPRGRRHSDAEGRARLLHRRAAQADVLRRHAEVLPRAGEGARRASRSRRSGKSDEGRELVVVWVSSEENIRNLQHNRDNLAKIADPRGLSEAQIQRADRDDEAALPPDGRPAQRRDGPVGDADGARLPPRDRDVAAHHADPQQRHRFGHAGRRAGRPRSQRRLVLSQRSTSRRRMPRRHAAGRRATPCRRRTCGGVGAAPVLGQVRLPRQQPRHQPVADVDARDHRLVLHGASADHARSARSAAADVHLQRRPAAEPQPRSDPLLRASRGSRTGRWRR